MLKHCKATLEMFFFKKKKIDNDKIFCLYDIFFVSN